MQVEDYSGGSVGECKHMSINNHLIRKKYMDRYASPPIAHVAPENKCNYCLFK